MNVLRSRLSRASEKRHVCCVSSNLYPQYKHSRRLFELLHVNVIICKPIRVLRLMSSRSGKIYLHTDIRLIFARDKFEYDSRIANYELRSFTEGPTNPEFSPKSWCRASLETFSVATTDSARSCAQEWVEGQEPVSLAQLINLSLTRSCAQEWVDRQEPVSLAQLINLSLTSLARQKWCLTYVVFMKLFII